MFKQEKATEKMYCTKLPDLRGNLNKSESRSQSFVSRSRSCEIPELQYFNSVSKHIFWSL